MTFIILTKPDFFNKLLPPKSYCLKEFKRFKEDNNRITGALMCNVAGTDMLLPLVVTKVKNPRAFQTKGGMEEFCEHFYNKTAWVNSGNFLGYLQQLDS